jgi:hypothetical protein
MDAKEEFVHGYRRSREPKRSEEHPDDRTHLAPAEEENGNGIKGAQKPQNFVLWIFLSDPDELQDGKNQNSMDQDITGPRIHGFMKKNQKESY